MISKTLLRLSLIAFSAIGISITESMAEECTGNDVYWSASVAGRNYGAYPILYQGFNQSVSRQKAIEFAAGCANANTADVNLYAYFNGQRGRVGINCGQNFQPCN